MIQNDQENEDFASMLNEYNEQYQPTKIKKGEIITGIVLSITNDTVILDINYKSEARVDISEFAIIPEVGEKIELLVVSCTSNEGGPILSYKQASERKASDLVYTAYKKKQPVRAKITQVVKNQTGNNVIGVAVQILPTNALGFVHISQMDISHISNAENYIGIEDDFEVIGVRPRNGFSFELSRRVLMEKKMETERFDFFQSCQKGDVYTVRVKKIMDFGAFVALTPYVDGLLHITDLLWSSVKKVTDVIEEGQDITVKVIAIDREKGKVNVSYREMQEHPWFEFAETHDVDDVLTGTVMNLTPYGAFVELTEGVQGLVHISEISWVERIKHPKEVLHTGQEVQVKILGIDDEEQKLSLGIKQLQDNPWDTIADRYPVGTKVSGIVKKVIDSGFFMEVESGIDGFVSLEDFSWQERYKKAQDFTQKGAEIEALVLNFDKKRNNLRLGIRQIENNPWQSLEDAHHIGDMIVVHIRSIIDNKIEVETVETKLLGFIPYSHVTDTRYNNIEDVIASMKIGQELRAVIIDISAQKQRLVLSLKELSKQEEKKDIEKYFNNEESSNITLGDFLKNKQQDMDNTADI